MAGNSDGHSSVTADAAELNDANVASDTGGYTDAAAEADAGPARTDWTPGNLESLPAFPTLRPLPGGAAGGPVFTSNNPEAFTSTGFLYQVARAHDVRGGESYPLSGDFGVYLHHVNETGGTKYLQLLVTNPNSSAITVSGEGSAWTSREIPLAQLGGPDYAVAEAFLTGTPRHTISTTTVASFKATTVWITSLHHNGYVDGRFQLNTSADAYVYLMVTDTDDVNEAVGLTQVAAAGDIRTPGDPPPPYGREAGVYASDRWAGAWTVDIPAAGHWVGYALNTATGTGHTQVQAFPKLTAFADSAKEAVGMYGNIYDLYITLAPALDSAAAVDVVLASHGGGDPNFWWNGPIEVDGALQPVWLAPESPMQTLKTVNLGALATVHLRQFVQGLSSIPFGLYLVAREP
jgi:hypothetical protein